jgi:hypothetical protein
MREAVSRMERKKGEVVRRGEQGGREVEKRKEGER